MISFLESLAWHFVLTKDQILNHKQSATYAFYVILGSAYDSATWGEAFLVRMQ